MMNIKVFSTLIIAVAITGCAKQPSSIIAADIPMSAYSNRSCTALSAELVKEHNKLTAVSSKQKSAAIADSIGVFLVAVPAASLSGGDKAGDVALSKGKINAIELAMKHKNCR